MADDRFDLVVIGSGQGGTALAMRAAKEGRRTALVERDRVGGSCINVGCTPSKTLIASARRAHLAQRGEEVGVRCAVQIDGRAVMERVRKVKENSRQSLASSLEDSDVRLVRGHGRFAGPHEVEAGGERMRGERILINTGARPRRPEIEGAELDGLLTNESVFDLKDVPESLCVLGGGVVGCELGQAFARLGSRVTLVHHGERLLGRLDKACSARLEEQFRRDGIDVKLKEEAGRIEQRGEGFRVGLNGGGAVDAARVLVAIGQAARTEDLGLEAAGVKTDERGQVMIDEQFRTSAEGVFAIGDVTPRPKFTHQSWEDHRRVAAAMWGDDGSSRRESGRREPDDLPVAYAVFTDPQVAQVGLTEQEARERGAAVEVKEYPLDESQRAREWAEPGGVLRAVVERESERLIGLTIVARPAAELGAAGVALLTLGATWRDLEQQMGIHPTYGELLPSLARKFMS